MEEKIIKIEDPLGSPTDIVTLFEENLILEDQLYRTVPSGVHCMTVDNVVKYHNPFERLRDSIFNFTRPYGHS